MMVFTVSINCYLNVATEPKPDNQQDTNCDLTAFIVGF